MEEQTHSVRETAVATLVVVRTAIWKVVIGLPQLTQGPPSMASNSAHKHLREVVRESFSEPAGRANRHLDLYRDVGRCVVPDSPFAVSEPKRLVEPVETGDMVQ